MFEQAPDLDCSHSGKPKTEVLWWKNDIRMSFPNMTYSVNSKVRNKGKYKCVAKNIFGNVSRQFYVIADDCLLNVETDFDRYHPLILTKRHELPNFYIKDEHLAIPINTTVVFFCEGGFNKFSDQSVEATCREGKTFEINREIVDYPKLKCKKALQPVTIQEDNCASGKGKLFRIGISVSPDKNFMEVYRICVDKKSRFLYTEHKIKPWAANVIATGMQIEKWLHSDVLSYNNNEMYDCKRQRQKGAISAILGRALPGNDDECYVARQLINEKDVPPGFPQLLTHSYLNIIPHWNSTATKYWNILEEIIRAETKKRIEKRTVTVITGVNYDVPAGEPQITITDKAGNSNKVPTFLWKVITDSMTASSVAIVQVNAPALLIGEKIKKYKVCDSKCNQINWLSEMDEEYIKSGFMLCCDIVTFEKIFAYKELFNEGHKKLLTSF
ncbi:uncharacterized protein LOC106711097 [Papilio machaon]|uniref:uncharacterized protein LOC106711097 n=1 Tax=Papilio machaon TaxID=76193 RepID=UPI001E6634A7|nr:uncharacterized protein LOC106711097 [Papilio machaon]